MRRRYRIALYYYGSTISRVGDEASIPALLLFGLAVSGSPQLAAAGYAALTLASAVGGPLLGLVLDRSARPGMSLAACLLLYGSGLVAIAVTGPFLPISVLLVLAAATGLFGPAVFGGWSAQLGHLLPGWPRAWSLDVGTYNVAGMAGPALAAVLATTLGAGWAMGAAAVLVFAAAPAAWLLPSPPPVPRVESSSLLRSLSSQLGAGLRPLLQVPALRGVTVGSSISFVGVGMLTVTLPLLGADRFGDPARGALLITVLAAASLLATLGMARWPPRLPPDQVFVVATVVHGIGLALTALTADPVLTVLSVAVVGLAEGPELAAVFAIRNRESPAAHRAQVFTTAASLKIGSAALGGVLAGALAAGSTVTGVLLLAALTQLLAVVATVVSRR